MIKDLGHIKVVKGDCKDCVFYKKCVGYNRTFAHDIFGIFCIDLIGAGNIFQKQETWEPCTKENTKVGDTVRWGGEYDDMGSSYKVNYILNEVTRFMLKEIRGIEYTNSSYMPNYEVKIGGN